MYDSVIGLMNKCLVGTKDNILEIPLSDWAKFAVHLFLITITMNTFLYNLVIPYGLIRPELTVLA